MQYYYIAQDNRGTFKNKIGHLLHSELIFLGRFSVATAMCADDACKIHYWPLTSFVSMQNCSFCN